MSNYEKELLFFEVVEANPKWSPDQVMEVYNFILKLRHDTVYEESMKKATT